MNFGHVVLLPRRSAIFAAILSLVLGLPSAFGASEDEYLVRNWTTVDGVPHNTVRSVIQSRDGYLWIGTANGLARFDGVRFTTFDSANTPELINDDIFSLYEGRDGTLWVRTRRGLARRTEGRFEFLPRTNTFSTVPFGSFAEDTAGALWILGMETIGRWNGRSLETVEIPPDGPERIMYMRAATDDGLWLAARNGLWHYRDRGAKRIVESPVPGLLAVGAGGQLWGLVAGRRLFTLRDGAWVQVTELTDICATLFAARNGDVWAGADSRNAAFRWRNGKLSTISSAQGLEGVRVVGFEEDQDGNIWIGMNAGGLYRLRERRVRIVGREEGFEVPNASSIVEQPDGSMLVSVMGSKLHSVTDAGAEPVPFQQAGPPLEHLTAMAPAREGGVWVGTFRGELSRVVDGRVVERVGSSSGTRSLLVDREARLWRGTLNAGVEVLEQGNTTRYRTNEGLSFNNVYCLAQDRDGAVWVGTEQGLNRIHNGRITVFGPTNGLGQLFVSTLCVDSRGTLWAGTLGGGLSGWTGTRFVTLTTREGLAHDAVDQLIEDDLRHLWLGTRAGLMRISVEQLHEFIAGKIRVVTGTLVGRDEGLERANLWTEYQPASAKSRDGRLWFCTGSGVAVLDPRRFEKPGVAPLVHIEEVSVDGVRRFVEPRLEPVIVVPPGAERVEIRYTGISPSEPAEARFRYRLEGYDREWVEARRQRVAGYSHLPPGQYQFRVKAVNNDGVWNETGAGITFDVRPQFWQTRWFRGAMAGAMAAALYGVFRLRLRQVESRRAAQEAFSRQLIASQEQERQRIAAELHDSLGQNLLVIKNRAALALAQQDRPEKMAAQVQEVSAMASAAVREVRDIAQNLRPFQIDELGITKSITAMARQLGDASNIEFVAELENIDGALPPEFEINFYRIAQECLNNVVKHSKARRAVIRLRRRGDALLFTVKDDGRGLTRADGAAPTGLGTRNIVERAHPMGGNVKIDSAPGQGVSVELEVPLR